MSNSRIWYRQVEALARANGAVLQETRGGHLCIRHPEGWRVYASSTPGDRRTLANTAATIRRYARKVA